MINNLTLHFSPKWKGTLQIIMDYMGSQVGGKCYRILPPTLPSGRFCLGGILPRLPSGFHCLRSDSVSNPSSVAKSSLIHKMIHSFIQFFQRIKIRINWMTSPCLPGGGGQKFPPPPPPHVFGLGSCGRIFPGLGHFRPRINNLRGCWKISGFESKAHEKNTNLINFDESILQVFLLFLLSL